MLYDKFCNRVKPLSYAIVINCVKASAFDLTSPDTTNFGMTTFKLFKLGITYWSKADVIRES